MVKNKHIKQKCASRLRQLEELTKEMKKADCNYGLMLKQTEMKNIRAC